MMKKALITGITGQDGSYLAELLINKGYEVHGIKRRSSLFNTERIDHIFVDFHESYIPIHLHYGDLTDSTSLIRIFQEIMPHEVYHLGAQSHVAVSFETPEYTAEVDAVGTLRMLEAIRLARLEHKIRFYQASSSEMFGLVQEVPQKETTPFYPRSPYGVAKVYAYWITVNYREAYNIFASNGILFNHESPRRGETFVTRKISRAAARIATGHQDHLYLGNLNALRDWGHAKDYVEAMWLMMQDSVPDDYVIATGEQHSVREFCEIAFHEAGVEIEWIGKGVEECAIDRKTGKKIIFVDPKYYRPTEVEKLLGDPSKAYSRLKWKPKISFSQLVKEMVSEDLKQALKISSIKKQGFLHHDSINAIY